MKKKILILLCFISLAAAPVKAMDAMAYQYYISANYFITTKQYDKAIYQLKKALVTSPDDAMLRTKLAGVYSEIGEWKFALAEYKEAARIKPDDAFVYVSIGNILQQNQDYNGALNAYMQAYQLFPEYKYNLLNIANVKMQLGDNAGASEFYQKFVYYYPDHLASRNNLASSYMEQGKYKEAIEEYRYIYKKNPADFKDYSQFALALFKTGDYKNAINGFKKALELDPDDAVSQGNLGLAYLQQEKPDKKAAKENLEAALQANPELDGFRFEYANLLSDENKFQESEEQYRKYIAKYPTDSDAYFNLGIAHQKMKKYDDAILDFQKTIELNKDSIDPKIELARTYQLKGDNFQAAEIYEAVLKTKNDDPDLYFNAGLAYSGQKKYDKALVYLQKSLSLKTSQDTKDAIADVYIGQATRLVNKEQYQQAAEQYKKALEYQPKAFYANSGLAFCYQKLGNSQKSIEYSENAIAIDPKNKEVFVAFGNTLNSQNKSDEAIGAYKRALELDPSSAAAQEGLGDAYLKNNMQEEAIKAYEKSLQLSENNSNINIKLGNIYKDNLNNEKAIAYYNKAIEINPSNTLALYNKAVTLFEQNKYTDAKACYAQIIKNDPDFDMAYYGMGIILEKEKKYKDAVTAYNKFIALTSNEALKSTIQRRIELLKARS
ncbi:MAG: tetratricopeptide repeat protein [Candidatus Gastranaerophilales bacterium]|nr:tetratricopeptide repeat protein [Candidatus Gastranaerophilales bacterium]